MPKPAKKVRDKKIRNSREERQRTLLLHAKLIASKWITNEQSSAQARQNSARIKKSALIKRLHKQQEQSAKILQEQEQERLRQQRATLVARKMAEGKAEACYGCVVQVTDLSDQEVILFYLDYPKQWNGVTGKWQQIDTAPTDAEAVSAQSAMGKILLGRFVGDEVKVELPSGAVVTYAVLDVKPYSSILEQQASKLQTFGSEKERGIYSGRGRREGGDAETLDGSKYIGFMARDGGQWGSFSIHDDYSDESNADGKDYDERFNAEG